MAASNKRPASLLLDTDTDTDPDSYEALLGS